MLTFISQLFSKISTFVIFRRALLSSEPKYITKVNAGS